MARIRAQVADAVHRVEAEHLDPRCQIAVLDRLDAKKIGAQVLLVAVAQHGDDEPEGTVGVAAEVQEGSWGPIAPI